MRLAVIPARGGSKRIPGKNIRPFAGKPIIAYSIETALRSRLFDHVVVSTDDDKIAEIAVRHGASVPFLRPTELAGDHTGTNEVVKHSIRWFQGHGHRVDFVCCIYATAPFLIASFLNEGLDKLAAGTQSFAFSVTSFPFPIQRALRISPRGKIEAAFSEHIFARSQDLEERFHDAGQFYWGRAEAFLNDEVIFSSASLPIILPRHLVQDIDTPEDWMRAELMFKAWKLGGEIN